MFGKLRKYVARAGLWAIRTLIREGKEDVAKFVVEDVLEDPKITTINNVQDFVRKKFPAIVGKRGF